MTVGQSRFTAVQFIEHAARRCGIAPALIPGESLASARDNLNLICANFVTQGMELWCVEKQVQGVTDGKFRYSLNDGTIDVMQVLRRTLVQYPGAIQSGDLVYSGDPVAIGSADFIVANTVAGATLKFQYSDDGSNFNAMSSVTGDFSAGDRVILDAGNVESHPYWRVMSSTANISSGTFNASLNEIPLGVMSRDDYVNLPNKQQLGLCNSYWVDKQIDAAQVVVWPVPTDATLNLVFWVHRQISDITSYTGLIEVPQRWQDAVIYELACRLFLELPKTMVDPSRYQILKSSAEQYLGYARRGETDFAPVKLAPRIRYYGGRRR